MIFLVIRIITMMLGVIVTYLLLCYFISHTQSEHVLIRAHQRRVAAGKKLKDVCGLELKVHKEHFQKDFEGKSCDALFSWDDSCWCIFRDLCVDR